jgi:tetratricopeptide (TPR) repeat protein
LYPVRSEVNTEWLRPWEALRTGDVEQGLRLLREANEQNPGPSSIVGLAKGYLWAGKFEAASEHYQAAAYSKITPNENMFGFAGAAEWHLGNVLEAVKLWKEGMKAPYAAGGVCSRTKMLLLMSSILQPGSFPQRDAELQLLHAVERIRSKWLASLGRLKKLMGWL